ncbi:MAG: MFS transporter [Planctomycetales bacterium]
MSTIDYGHPAPRPAPRPLTGVQWLICIIAAIGFTFDTYELLMLPLVIEPALTAVHIPKTIAAPGGGITLNPEFKYWGTLLFFVPALLGGVFGLLGGYLTDRLGRRRMLTFSILLYAFSAFASGFSTTPEMLLFFRCLTFIGVCLEFVAATAWLAELFPEPLRREKVLGYTQAFGSAGGFLVAAVNGWLVDLKTAGTLPAVTLPDWLNFFGGDIAQLDPSGAWRYTLMSGLIPAFPLIVIRPFLPESPEWQRKKDAGTLRRPSLGAIFAPDLRRTTIVTTLMVAFTFGAAFGAIQHMPRMVSGLPEVRERARQAVEKLTDERAAHGAQPSKKEIRDAVSAVEESVAADVVGWQEIGGIVGRLLLAVLAVRILSRRRLIWVFLVPGLVLMPLTFGYAAVASLDLLYVGMFLVALFTIAQMSFWGNYLPRVYPVHLRGTGESCAANIGGRMLGTSFAALLFYISGASWMLGDTPSEKLAYTAAAIGTLVFAGNLVLSFWLPEPESEALPD